MTQPETNRGLVHVPPERINRTWTIYVCTEPDGEKCASGTHPYILRHECAALARWHEAMAARKSPDEPVAERGPTIAAIEVAPYNRAGELEREAENLRATIWAYFQLVADGRPAQAESLLRSALAADYRPVGA